MKCIKDKILPHDKHIHLLLDLRFYLET